MFLSLGFTDSLFLLLLALCFALFLAPGDMCKELRLQVPHPGDDKGFCRGGSSAVDHPEEQPSASCAWQSSQYHTGKKKGTNWTFACKKKKKKGIDLFSCTDLWLSPIEAWADAFRSSPDLTGVVSVYEDLRRKGLEFPMTELNGCSTGQPRQKVMANIRVLPVSLVTLLSAHFCPFAR